jgi:ABC-2 type transport system permease protein
VHGFLGPNGAGKSTGAALAYVPALWVVTGFAVAVVGLVPRWSWLAWVGVAYPFAIYYRRTYLSAPAWSDALSPYSHVALVPAEHVSWWSLLALVGVAAALIAVGIGAFRRRDVMPG